MPSRGEYIDFKFGDYWASDFNLWAVSKNDRHSAQFYGNFDTNTSTVIGKRGVYKWNTQINEKTIPLTIAFDNFNIMDLNKIRKWLTPKKVQKLYLSEEPYKYYYAVLSQDVDFNFIPFKDSVTQVGDYQVETGLLKGEMSLEFLCIDNVAYSDFDSYEEAMGYSWQENDSVTLNIVDADDVDEIAPVQDSNTEYYTLVTKMVEMIGNNSSYNVIGNTCYTFVSSDPADLQEFAEIKDYLEQNGLDADEYFCITPGLFEQMVSEGGSDILVYNLPESGYEFKIIEKPLLDVSVLPPWVFNSNLLDSTPLYNSKNIYLKSFTEKDTGDSSSSGISASRPLYLLNSGTTDAKLSLTFDLIKIVEGQNLVIEVKKARITNSGWVIGEIVSKFEISYFENYKPFVDFVGDNFDRDNSNLCELYLINKTTGDKMNLNKFNETQDFLTLIECNFVNYLQPFPTSLSEVEGTAIESTYFNQIKIAQGLPYRLKNVSLEWKHTYI
jgi:hypothetical protein